MSLRVGAAGAALALGLVLGGCAWIDTSYLDPISPGERASPMYVSFAVQSERKKAVVQPGKDECLVLATALDAVATNWRTNPKEHTLKISTYAVSADRIDGGHLADASGLVPPKGLAPIDVGACGTLLAATSNDLDIVEPQIMVPNGSDPACRPTGEAWVSRPGFDADHGHAAVLYANDACRGTYWLVRLRKDYRGMWIAEPPDPLYRPG